MAGFCCRGCQPETAYFFRWASVWVFSVTGQTFSYKSANIIAGIRLAPPPTASRSSSESSSLALAVLAASGLASLVCAASRLASPLPAGGGGLVAPIFCCAANTPCHRLEVVL
jgi:hypothetical protein